MLLQATLRKSTWFCCSSCALADEERGLGRMRMKAADEAVAAKDCSLLEVAMPVAPITCLRSQLRLLWRAASQGPQITATEIVWARCFAKSAFCGYDKAGEEHYNLISALHKSVRNSDPDAALYWLGRMIEAGEDPLYIARRVVRMAVEDIGLAEPNALSLCMAARDAVDFIGMPGRKSRAGAGRGVFVGGAKIQRAL